MVVRTCASCHNPHAASAPRVWNFKATLCLDLCRNCRRGIVGDEGEVMLSSMNRFHGFLLVSALLVGAVVARAGARRVR